MGVLFSGLFVGYDKLGYNSKKKTDLLGNVPLIKLFFRFAGTIGHVAHGKSTVVKAISGVMTVRFKNELVRNITIKLGYANAKVRPYTILVAKKNDSNQFNLCSRFTSVKMKHVQGQGAIVPIVRTRKIIHHVNDLDADIK